MEVRKGAHLFYWLHYTTANVSAYTERPLVIWLQGGPGVASTGCGVFEQLGPVDIEGKARAWNWVQHMNVLFIDSPVGTGFSYVEPHGRYATTNRRIAKDLVALMVGFLQQHEEFREVPLHIFSESYGGKMAPEFALELYLAKQRDELQCQLMSVVVGNPWTSPLDSTLSYAPYLLQMGIVDHDGYRNISRVAAQIARLVYDKQWLQVVEKNSDIQEMIETHTGGIFLYNVQRRMHEDDDFRYGEDPKLRAFMLSNVTQALNLTHMSAWMAQNATVFMRLGRDLFKPAVHIGKTSEQLSPHCLSAASLQSPACSTRRRYRWASTRAFWTCSVPRLALSTGSTICSGITRISMWQRPVCPFESMACWRATRSRADASACSGSSARVTWCSRRIR